MAERPGPSEPFKPAVEEARLIEPESPATIESRSREAFDSGLSDYWARFGATGHEHEYTVHVRGYDASRMMPSGFDRELKRRLGEDWQVLNRGSRIELYFLGDENGSGGGTPQDAIVEPVLNELFDAKKS